MKARQRQEMADFLRKRRACLDAKSFGFAERKRRRTPGLRREDVAALAGISLDWYTWLEQARDVQPSRATLNQIADAFRLEPIEKRYLLALGGFSGNLKPGSRNEFLEPTVCRIIEELHACPCVVIGRRWDFLAWNAAAALLYGDLDAMRGNEANGLWQYFDAGHFARTAEDRSARAAKAVAIFRMERLKFLEDPFFDELITALARFSKEFRDLWAGHEIDICDPEIGHFNHPRLGRLSFEHSAYDLNDSANRGFRVVTYVPMAGTPTRARIQGYLAERRAADAAA